MTQDSRLRTHEDYMHRCLELAEKGSGYVAPNPMVGAVLVHNGKIIGEGYHRQYGQAHAEVNCINSVDTAEKSKIKDSALYVSLEPCAHFGKTPPCTDLIISNQISEVVIGCRDPFKEVDGKGIENLKAAGVNVIYGILEKECQQINKRFFTYHKKHRPFIILKWAETGDGKIAGTGTDRLHISNDQTSRLVHKWRSEEASILVGTNTVLLDDPELTTRNWEGPSPVRLVIDMDLKLPLSLKIFNDKQKTIVFNRIKHEESDSLNYYQVTEDVSLVHQIVNALYQMRIQSLIVEGGAKLLQSFIDEEMWDEARIIKNEKLIIKNGLAAPELPARGANQVFRIVNDSIKIYFKEATTFSVK
ncbi:MAG TPA: bifunctional diaminohydroxyphosphoribosylaminopyrimidine deaminase/5-amino-6-(5-phosphoribosylamino)uracil reductase RibD [Chitinophagaceae bacterium]|nr:bifunctional diaminohydroxyphosphoribosylaminopyrimidine deaminase/5-amino-6-(5-phosphoribosylamino)uracil reductase RibD [Chitinophagaceae bacterium]